MIDIGGEFKSLKLKVLHKTELSLEEEKRRYQSERQHGIWQRLERKSRLAAALQEFGDESCCSAESLRV